MKKTLLLIFGLLLIAGSLFAAEKNTTAAQGKAFALAKEPPLSSFKYELTDDLEGVRITAYNGDDIHIRIPSEIEGVPVRELGERLFSNKEKIETVIIPDTIQSIARSLFSGCRALKNVKLPISLTSIPECTFLGCESLEVFTIPAHITNIERSAFAFSGLKSIYIPDGVTFLSPDEYSSSTEKMKISSFVFGSCKNLETVRLPSSITNISAGMFDGCESLRSIILPEGITEIGERAFRECSSLTELIIPNSVTTIRIRAFDKSGIKSLIIPDSVDTLECLFGTCSKLEHLRLPNSLTKISDDLFHGPESLGNHNSLKSINLPTSLKKLDTYVFSSLKSLQELIIPDSITELEFSTDWEGKSNAFEGTSLPLATQKRLRQLGYRGKF